MSPTPDFPGGLMDNERRFVRMRDVEVAPLEPFDALLTQIVDLLADGQARARGAVGVERLRVYYAIGTAIRHRQREQGWGAQVIDRLSADLRVRFPGNRGLGPRNLRYMRDLAQAWPDLGSGNAVAKLPWGHVTDLLARLDDAEVRDWYAVQASPAHPA